MLTKSQKRGPNLRDPSGKPKQWRAEDPILYHPKEPVWEQEYTSGQRKLINEAGEKYPFDVTDSTWDGEYFYNCKEFELRQPVEFDDAITYLQARLARRNAVTDFGMQLDFADRDWGRIYDDDDGCLLGMVVDLPEDRMHLVNAAIVEGFTVLDSSGKNVEKSTATLSPKTNPGII